MRVLYGRDALAPPAEGSAVTVGTFDGLHRGHRALIARTVAEARAARISSVVVTWDRHPLQTLRPERAPRLLVSPERKLELLGETGVDAVAVLPFDRDLASWAPERFVREVLSGALGARAVIVGRGWRFGRGATGDVGLLEAMGSDLGFRARAVDLERDGSEPVSSSRIREAVAAGDVETARGLLGRPFDISGVVIRGAGRGKGLGFPTANLDTPMDLVHPARGVYAGCAEVDGLRRPAAVNVGVNPTFGGDPATSIPKVEAYLLDFDGDLYGATLRVEFASRLRDELLFETVDGLVEQMREDVEATRAVTC